MLFRKIAHGKNDWGRLKWMGLTMDHPLQQDTSSCGVIVTMVMSICVCLLKYLFFSVKHSESELYTEKFSIYNVTCIQHSLSFTCLW